MGKYRFVAAIVCMSISTQALAAPKWLVQPVQTGEQSVRYEQGVPTVDMELNDGVIQITPLPYDHGSIVLGVAVYNDAYTPANFGIENVHVTFAGEPVKVFSKDDLVRRAKNRATWSQIGLAVLGGLAAAGAASQRDHYKSTFVTPRGTYRSYWSMPSAAGQFQATALAAGTGVGIAAIQSQLDDTVRALGDQVVQLTTIDPGESYAGKIVLDKIRPKSFPAPVTVMLDWNGERYSFTFQLAKPGTPTPVFATLARESDLTNFAERRDTTVISQPQTAVVAEPIIQGGATSEPVIQPAVLTEPVPSDGIATQTVASHSNTSVRTSSVVPTPIPTPAHTVRPTSVAIGAGQGTGQVARRGLRPNSGVTCTTCQ